MALDAVRTSEIVDAVVIVSGDGDFIPLVEYLKGKGRRVEIMAFDRTASQKLKEAVDDFTDIGANPKFLLRTRSQNE